MVVIHMHNRADASNIRGYIQEYAEEKWSFIIYRAYFYDD